MERNFAAVTVFTLLFAVSTARISLDLTPTNNPVLQITDVIKSPPESAVEDSNNVVLPTETTKSESDAINLVQQTRNDRIFRVDLTPRSDLARFHAINRQFFGEPRLPRSVHRGPCRHFLNPFVVPRSKISQRNKAIFSGETSKFDAEKFHRQTTMKQMKFKRNSGHRHHRHKYHHHIQHGSNDVPIRKHRFDGEKVKSLVHHHKGEKLEHEAGFMKSIRKFLKHTFD